MGKNPIPPLLYRYRPLEDLELGYLREVLLENKIYASSPAYFNDPFDCKVRIPASSDPTEWRQVLDRSLKRHKPDLKYARRRRMVTQIMAKSLWSKPETREGIERDLQADINGVGVLCFCESGENPLMWAYYASGHRGFCLTFRTLRGTIFHETEEIEYSVNYPIPRLSADSEEQVKAFLLTKSECWKHEKEWRFIGYQDGPGHREFPSDALEAIILGCQVASEVRNQILELVARRPQPLRLLQAKPRANTFELQLLPDADRPPARGRPALDFGHPARRAGVGGSEEGG